MVGLRSVSVASNKLTGVILPQIVNAWANCFHFKFDGNSGIVNPPCEGSSACPENSACEQTAELRFGVFDFQCTCQTGYVNEANQEIQDVPILGTCLETIPLEVTRITSTSLHAQSQSPAEGFGVLYNLEKFVSSTRREAVSVYTNLPTVEYVENYAPYDFANLDPGSRYVIKATIMNSSTVVHPEYDPAVVAAETTCNCVESPDGDTSGRPREVSLEQVGGHVLFSFVDNSRCEEAFSFSRRLVDPDSLLPIDGENVSVLCQSKLWMFPISH